MTKFRENRKKPYFWANLGQKSAIMAKNGQIRFFFKNPAPSLFKLGNFLSSCKKSEKSNEPILRKAPDERTDTDQFMAVDTKLLPIFENYLKIAVGMNYFNP